METQTPVTDKYMIAAIIGYWRCGAPIEYIMAITGLYFWKVEKIINSYQKNK